MISRQEVVQGLLNLFDRPRYLEIGISGGATFASVRAASKVAVDPSFKFDAEEAGQQNPEAKYHQLTSDHFFGETIAPGDAFDVIFLDGLHTLEQTLRDLLNALSYLTPHGVVVIDDVIPNSYVASLPSGRLARLLGQALNVTDPSWMGDVYKLVFFIESFLQQYEFRTVEENHGQLILWKARRSGASLPGRTLEEIGRLPFEQVIFQASAFRLTPYDQILGLVRRASQEPQVLV